MTLAKKPFAMTDIELGDAHEERVAKALNGRVQVGSGRVKVATLRSDVLAIPFLIECKATRETTITIKYDVWTDLIKKVKETMWLPSYSLSVVDGWGDFYDFVGIDKRLISDKLLKKICPNGLMQVYEVNKTAKISCLIEASKNRKYIDVLFKDYGMPLSFVPLERLKPYYKELTSNL